jgi:5S rRNA maturation endonuclease (ribonuclease M5)
MTTMTKTSRSYNQHELKIICDKLCDNFESLLTTLGVYELKEIGKMYAGPCPIHDGDNLSAFNLYPTGDVYRGNWKCRTHGCEKIFKSSIIGFIRGVLSNKKNNWNKNGDLTVSFNDTMLFVEDFLNENLDDIKVSNDEIEKKKFSTIIGNITKTNTEIINKDITKKIVRKSLSIPSDYFLQREFSSEILDKYDVGNCLNKNKEMYGRAVVPIYDISYKYVVGCSGRSIYEKCTVCKHHHDPKQLCPDQEDLWKYSKWKHNKDFKSQNHLYNFWFAKDHILNSSQVILVESPGNVWKLEQHGIHNSVAMFGSSLSDRQKILLDGSGAMNIIILTDNDDAGDKAAQIIEEKCKNTYKVKRINITKSDVAEMNSEEINNQIKKFL